MAVKNKDQNVTKFHLNFRRPVWPVWEQAGGGLPLRGRTRQRQQKHLAQVAAFGPDRKDTAARLVPRVEKRLVTFYRLMTFSGKLVTFIGWWRRSVI